MPSGDIFMRLPLVSSADIAQCPFKRPLLRIHILSSPISLRTPAFSEKSYFSKSFHFFFFLFLDTPMLLGISSLRAPVKPFCFLFRLRFGKQKLEWWKHDFWFYLLFSGSDWQVASIKEGRRPCTGEFSAWLPCLWSVCNLPGSELFFKSRIQIAQGIDYAVNFLGQIYIEFINKIEK